jgi:hypothetical protein
MNTTMYKVTTNADRDLLDEKIEIVESIFLNFKNYCRLIKFKTQNLKCR